MGLFDTFKDSLGNTIESLIMGPMSKEEKALYDIIVDLLFSASRLKKDYIQKFIETKYENKCDLAVLDKVLQKFDTVTRPNTNEIWYTLTSVQISRTDYKNGGVSRYNKEEIYDICYSDFCDEIRVKFKNEFEVIDSEASKKLFEQAISNIVKDLPPVHDNYPHKEIALKTICEEILASMVNGNSFVKETIIYSVLSRLIKAYEKQKKYEYMPLLYSFVLRAFNFDKYDKKAGKYTSITKTDCLSTVKIYAYYRENIDANTVEAGNSIVEKAADSILESKIILSFHDYEWDYWAMKNPEFVDAACFYTWKKIIDVYGKKADTVEDTAGIVYGFIEYKSTSLQ